MTDSPFLPKAAATGRPTYPRPTTDIFECDSLLLNTDSENFAVTYRIFFGQCQPCSLRASGASSDWQLNTKEYEPLNSTIIVFDLDGTLIDSVHDVRRALNRTLAPLGRGPQSLEEVKGYLGSGAPVLMDMAIRATGDPLDEVAITELTRTFLDDYASNPVVETVVFPSVFEVLGDLGRKGAALAICTNKPSITAAPVLDLLGLSAYFDVIVCGDQVKNRKPHGDHILETIQAAGGDPARAVMVGDSENDIEAAIHASVPSVAVTFGYSIAPHMELGADVLIDHFYELPGAVETLLSSDKLL